MTFFMVCKLQGRNYGALKCINCLTIFKMPKSVLSSRVKPCHEENREFKKKCLPSKKRSATEVFIQFLLSHPHL